MELILRDTTSSIASGCAVSRVSGSSDGAQMAKLPRSVA